MDELQDTDTGYPLTWFVEQKYVTNLYVCAICRDVLRDTVQIQGCGHQFCERCINGVLSRSSVQRLCPTCRKRISRETLFNDNAARRTISNLSVKCPRTSCEWEGNLGQLIQSHHQLCDFRILNCANKDCEARIHQKDMVNHRIGCKHRLVACHYCTLKYQVKDRAEHLETCTCLPVACTNKCSSKNIPRNKMKDHKEKNCPKTIINCKYYQHGCMYKDERGKMEGHEKEEYEKHLELQGKAISRMEAKHNEEIEKLRKELKRIELITSENQARLEDNAVYYEEEMEKLEEELTSKMTKKEANQVFKISEFNKKLMDAKRGNTDGVLVGVPFKTSLLGYKMKMDIYLNETRKDYKDHLGVYIHLMKSDYDSILSWPFKKKCTFTLIDQQENVLERDNIVMTLTPDDHENFKRPKTDCNQGYGFPNFVSHETLKTRKYVKDDTVFITIHTEQ